MSVTVGGTNDKTIGKVIPSGNGGATNQNNIPKLVALGIIDPTNPLSLQGLLDNLNLTVTETDTPVYFKTLSKDFNGVPTKQLWEFPLGKGIYNPVGSTISSSQLILIEDGYPALSDIEDILLEGNLIDLGTIDNDLVAYINTQLNILDLSDDTVINYVQFKRDEIKFIYQYNGLPLVYGTLTANTAVFGDFDLIYQSTTIPFDQNNITRIYDVGVLNGNDPDALFNNLYGIDLTVKETDSTIYFKSLTKEKRGILSKQIWQFTKGKGEYIPVADTLDMKNDIVLIEQTYPKYDDLENLFLQNNLINLGEIKLDLISHINKIMTELDLSDDSFINYIEFLKDGITYIYEYKSIPTIYGTSTDETAEIYYFDLIFQSSNENLSNSPLQSLQDTLNVDENGTKISLNTNNAFIYGNGFNNKTNNSVEINEGRILIVGNFTEFDGVSCNRIAVLTTEGILDSNFVYGTGFNSPAYYCTFINNKIYVCGSFTQYNGVSCGKIISLNLDGTINTDINFGSGFDYNVLTITNVGNKLYLGGDFSNYNGVSCGKIISLNLDGTINTDCDFGIGFTSDISLTTVIYSILFKNNKLYISGGFNKYKGIICNCIVTINLDGTIINDISFNIESSIYRGYVISLAIDDSNNVYASGQFTETGNSEYTKLLKTDINGNKIPSFNINFLTNQIINDLALLNDKIIICGQLSGGGAILSNNGNYLYSFSASNNTNLSHITVLKNGLISLTGEAQRYGGVLSRRHFLVDEKAILQTNYKKIKFSFNKGGNEIAEYFTDKTFDQLEENELVPKRLMPLSNANKLIEVVSVSGIVKSYISLENTNVSRGDALKLAILEAVAGDTVFVYNGTYDCYDLAKDGVNYHFFNGVKIIYTGNDGANIFTDNNVPISISVTGEGEIINNGTGGSDDTIRLNNKESVFNIKAKKIISLNNRAVVTYAGRMTIEAIEIRAKDGVIDCVGSNKENVFVTITADTIFGEDNYAIEHDGGEVVIYANKLISTGVSVGTITTASGSGSLKIYAKEIISNTWGIEHTSQFTRLEIHNSNFKTTDLNFIGMEYHPAYFFNCLDNGSKNIRATGTIHHLEDGYKEFSCLINFNALSNPSIIVLKNTFYKDIQFIRSEVGIFTSNIEFRDEKTILTVPSKGFSTGRSYTIQAFIDNDEYNSSFLAVLNIYNAYYINQPEIEPNGNFQIPINIKEHY